MGIGTASMGQIGLGESCLAGSCRNPSDAAGSGPSRPSMTHNWMTGAR